MCCADLRRNANYYAAKKRQNDHQNFNSSVKYKRIKYMKGIPDESHISQSVMNLQSRQLRSRTTTKALWCRALTLRV